MKYTINISLLCFILLLLPSFTKAQKNAELPVPSSKDTEWECGLTEPPLVQLNISIHSSKKGSLKDLTYRNFRVYDEKEFQEIEFFKFDEIKNQYVIGFHQIRFPVVAKWHDIKVKVNLPKGKNKDYGKISVEAPKGYYATQN